MLESEYAKQVFQVDSLPLASVTVFNDRAEVKRIVKAVLEHGVNEIAVENISKFAEENSIKVDRRGDAIIHEVNVHKKAFQGELQSPRLKILNEQKKGLNAERVRLDDKKGVLEKEIQVLDQMVCKAGGSLINKSDMEKQTFELNDDDLKSMTDFFEFYAKVSLEKRGSLRQCLEAIIVNNEKIRKIDAEINQIRNTSCFARNVTVLLECVENREVELDISYQVWHAKWRPSYDIRVFAGKNGQSVMKVAYYGRIEQNTGEDWLDAPIILSTARPALGGSIPELGTLNASFYEPPQPRPLIMKKKMRAFAVGIDAHDKDEEMKENAIAVAPLAQPVVTVDEATLSTTFTISRPATILSGSGEHSVTVTTLELDPIIAHETVPCKDTNVYVTASAVNTLLFPFLAGEASVYFGNSFVAKTNLKSVSPGEKFICSLGVDPAIRIIYKPAQSFSEQVGIIAKSVFKSHEQKLIVRNTKQTKILLTIRELIPKSTDEKIKIRLYSPELTQKQATDVKDDLLLNIGTKLDKNHNLEWTFDVGPNREIDLLIKWTIEHPNSEIVEFSELQSLQKLH